jgi:hypothetical protein
METTTTARAAARAPETAPGPAAAAPRPTHNAYTAARARLTGSAAKAEALFAHYPDAIRQDAVWLWHFVRTKCNDQHAMLGAIARSLGLKDRSGKEPSDQYWYQVVRGHYFKSGGDAGIFHRYVAAFRAHARAREEGGAVPFIETRNWTLIRDYIETRRAAGAVCRFGGIEGETGAGKASSLKHYNLLNNHCETVCPPAPASFSVSWKSNVSCAAPAPTGARAPSSSTTCSASSGPTRRPTSSPFLTTCTNSRTTPAAA